MYIPIIRISFLLSSNTKFRYDVEYDENRIAIAVDIGRRFLAIDTPTALNNGICDIGAVILSANENAVDADDANNTSSTIDNNTAAETENHNNTTAINSSSNNHKNYEHHNGDEHNSGSEQQQKHVLSDGSAIHDAGGSGGGDSGVDAGDTVGGGSGEGSGGGGGGDDTGGGVKEGSNCHYNSGVGKLNPATGDELVLDVLNDDLIARVRDKITSGNKELFEPCVTAVKAFLAGEPFQEFETSMYFHRWVWDEN